MPLVEVVRAELTADEVYEDAYAFAAALGKEPVRCNDTPGFVANRVLIPLLNDCVRVLDEARVSPEDLDRALRYGANWPIGPCALIDLIGIDVHVHASDALWQALREPRMAAPPRLHAMAKAGLLGRKSGRGFYSYELGRVCQVGVVPCAHGHVRDLCRRTMLLGERFGHWRADGSGTEDRRVPAVRGGRGAPRLGPDRPAARAPDDHEPDLARQKSRLVLSARGRGASSRSTGGECRGRSARASGRRASGRGRRTGGRAGSTRPSCRGPSGPAQGRSSRR